MKCRASSQPFCAANLKHLRAVALSSGMPARPRMAMTPSTRKAGPWQWREAVYL